MEGFERGGRLEELAGLGEVAGGLWGLEGIAGSERGWKGSGRSQVIRNTYMKPREYLHKRTVAATRLYENVNIHAWGSAGVLSGLHLIPLTCQ